MNTEMEKARTPETAEEVQTRPEKADYLERIKNLSAEDQAFMDGYLFAKLTSRPRTA